MRAKNTMDYTFDEVRLKDDQMTARAYNLSIGLILLWGFIINALMCAFTSKFFTNILEASPIGFWIAYIVVALLGIVVCNLKKGVGITLFGYHCIIFAVGTTLAICVPQFSNVSILNACIITVILTLIMIALSTIKPDVFLSMGKTLLICLTFAVIIEFIMLLFKVYHPTIWDFVIVLLFCGFIGYDWASAQQERKTFENAVYSSTGLYLDIINIFVRLLGKGSGSRKSSK